jgi:gliding motility-associated-like protein
VITVRPALAISGIDRTICANDTVTLRTTASGGITTAYTYEWNPNVSTSDTYTPSPNLANAGTYSYTITLSDGCSSPATTVVNVNVNPRPFVVINPVTNVCVPAAVAFSSTTDIGATWSWDIPGVGTSTNEFPSFNFNTAGTYDVTLTVGSAAGCTTTVSQPAFLTIYPKPVASFTADHLTTTIVNPTFNFIDQSTNPNQWSWNFGDEATDSIQNPVHMYQDTGKYVVQLIVTSIDGCIDDTTVIIQIDPDHVIYVPNAFSPNGDLLNDRFMPDGVGIDPDKFEMIIFDRWGNQIFRTSKIYEGWDGKANSGSTAAQEDVYIWKIKAQGMNGEPIERMGHVSLIK